MANVDEITDKMSELTGWTTEGNSIAKDFDFEGFRDAIEFVNKVAQIADSEDHYPEIIINYSYVRLVLVTHEAGGLTEKDFIVAKKIDELG